MDGARAVSSCEFDDDTNAKASSSLTKKIKTPTTSHEPGARAGSFLKDATKSHDAWRSIMADADDALRRASLLRAKIAAAVDLIEATEKIDPSGIRVAIEKVRVPCFANSVTTCFCRPWSSLIRSVTFTGVLATTTHGTNALFYLSAGDCSDRLR